MTERLPVDEALQRLARLKTNHKLSLDDVLDLHLVWRYVAKMRRGAE